jgi:hypothetical protein
VSYLFDHKKEKPPMKTNLILIALATAAATATPVQSADLPGCYQGWYDIDSVPVGWTCAVSPGVAYQRVNRPGFNGAWKDLQTGLIWSNKNLLVKGENFAYWDDAWDFCEGMNAHLPLPEECAEMNIYVKHFPMAWTNIHNFWSARLDDYNGQTIEFGARYCNGGHPEFSNSRNSGGSYGGWDRRSKSDIYTICVDDSEVIHKRERPLKPTPVVHRDN